MRIALISFIPETDNAASAIIYNLVSAAESCGHQVDRINGLQELVNSRLTIYDYIGCIAVPSGFFSGSVSPKIARFLAVSGTIASKKAAALVIKRGLFAEKACRHLMRIMESEGVKLDYFELVRDRDHARLVGKKLG